MTAAGAAIDPDFPPSEELYLRLKTVLRDNTPAILGQLRFPDFSVNRQRYSDPADVLKPSWPDWGIVSFTVADIPGPVESPPPAADEFEFRAEHVPVPGNYAHSEVCSYKNGKRADRRPPRTVRLSFRIALWERLDVVRESSLATAP